MIFESLELASPWYLLVLVFFIPLLFGWLGKKEGILSSDWEYSRKRVHFKRYPFLILNSLMILVSLLLVISLAGPRARYIEKHPLLGRDIIVVFDVSYSMGNPLEGAMDYYSDANKDEPSKFDKARELFFSFVNSRPPEDRVGLILFSGESYAARLPTNDHEILKKDTLEGDPTDPSSSLYHLRGSTNIPIALKTAALVLDKYSQTKEKVIILISDVEDTKSEVIKVVETLLNKDFKIYILAVKASDSIKDRLIQRFSGNKNFLLLGMEGEDDFIRINSSITKIEKSPVGMKETVVRKDISHLFITSALVLLTCWFLLVGTKFMRVQ